MTVLSPTLSARLVVGGDGVVQLAGLINPVNVYGRVPPFAVADYENNAVCVYTLYNGTTPIISNEGMLYVAGSMGVYRGPVPDATTGTLAAGKIYLVKAVATTPAGLTMPFWVSVRAVKSGTPL